jgi:hypothetical protein
MAAQEKSQAFAGYRRRKTTFTIDTMKEFILWCLYSFPATSSPGKVG